MRTLIKGGLVLDPANRIQSVLNVLMEDGRIAAVTEAEPVADEVVDAAGCIVAPGFIDIHMHEDPLNEDGTLYRDEDKAIFNCMLRMGVTTAIGGQCGINVHRPSEYLDVIDREGAAVNVGMFAGHAFLREQAGHADKYSRVTEEELRAIENSAARELDGGCLGVSFGIRYVPGIDAEELRRTAAPCRRDGKVIAAHIRDDAAQVVPAARELLEAGRVLGVSAQVSHIGSMGGFGQMRELLRLVDGYRIGGLDASCDCYPYTAFSTMIGSTTYDDGWRERYGCGYDAVEICEGKYRGRRCTEEIFNEVRRDNPECLTVCYVMAENDIDMAMAHPNVMLASDGIMNHGQGHPRAAGAFPRLFAEYVRTGKLPLYEAVRMATIMPAEKLGLKSKGRLTPGADADVIVFDPEKIADRATFMEPTLPPVGIDGVWIGGRLAAKDCRIVNGRLGSSVRK